MVYKIAYKASIAGDLKKIDKSQARKLVTLLETKLGQNPDLGEPLKGEFHGLFKYRIGDYRIIYAKREEDLLILRIAHRKNVYR